MEVYAVRALLVDGCMVRESEGPASAPCLANLRENTMSRADARNIELYFGVRLKLGEASG